MFGHGQARRIEELETQLRQLRGQLSELEHAHLELDRCVARWMKQDRTRQARATADRESGSAASVAHGSPEPPPGLRGARLRIWNRRHGISSTDGTAIQVPMDESESEETNGVSP